VAAVAADGPRRADRRVARGQGWAPRAGKHERTTTRSSRRRSRRSVEPNRSRSGRPSDGPLRSRPSWACARCTPTPVWPPTTGPASSACFAMRRGPLCPQATVAAAVGQKGLAPVCDLGICATGCASRHPHGTGQTEVVFEPVAFLRRLAARVPPARQHQVRYFGRLASHANDHHRLVDLAHRAVDAAVADPDAGADPAAAQPRRYRTRWAALLARGFDRQTDCSRRRAGDRSDPDHASVPSAVRPRNRGGRPARAVG